MALDSHTSHAIRPTQATHTTQARHTPTHGPRAAYPSDGAPAHTALRQISGNTMRGRIASFIVGPWRGAAGWVLAAGLAVAATVGSALKTGLGSAADALLASLVLAVLVTAGRAAAAGVGAAVRLVPWRALHVLSRMPPWPLARAVAAVLSGIVLALPWVSSVYVLGLLVFGVPLVLLAAVSAGLVSAARRRRGHRPLARMVLALAVAPYVAATVWLAAPGTDAYLPAAEPLVGAGTMAPLPAAQDPSQRGSYAVRALSYGSGADRRSEYGAAADLKTPTVDASALLPRWSGFKAGLRERYWGFGPRNLPLNARVWAPEEAPEGSAGLGGDGPFPLVLFVHGNANMADPSEAGYAYLGELLASRGFIAASVDQNFLNASWADDLRGDMPARAWLLLKHLELWRDWNATPGHPFHGKLDLDDVALVGHSRGGEAVAIAAALTRSTGTSVSARDDFAARGVAVPDLPAPVKAVVAIAPTDGTYRPGGALLALHDVSYLGIEGGHDGNGPSLIANRQYQRVAFSAPAEGSGAPGRGRFKATVYAPRANHGQFNTVWGRLDLPRPLSWLMNTRPLLAPEAQRQIARVYVGAFLEATLRGAAQYVPVLRDHRSASGWLPADGYVTSFEDPSFRAVADFEEDDDLTTAAVPGTTLRGERLAVWREQPLDAASTPPADGSGRAAYLAWAAHERGQPPAFSATLPHTVAGQWHLGARSELVFSLAVVGGPASVDVELVGHDGTASRLPLSHFAPVRPMSPTQVMKVRAVGRALGLDLGEERVLQTYALPLEALARATPAFDPAAVKTIRLHFDAPSGGAVLLDRIGFASR